jgi:galactosyl transferase GMA12/MNN10 family
MNNAIILQQVYSQSPYANMLRLSFARHMEYACKHKFDMQVQMTDITKDHPTCFVDGALAPMGAWAKLFIIRDALRAGYEYVCWIDADALIFDTSVDLREAFKEFDHIGACQHPGPPVHLNVGVVYYRNTQPARDFVEKWISYYGDKTLDGWMEQGVFNRLTAETGFVKRIDDRWNATHYAGTDVAHPVILGYHGPAAYTPFMRFQAMMSDMARVI